MIVLLSKYNPATGKVERVRRDLTATKCKDMICEYSYSPTISSTELPYVPKGRGSRFFYKVHAAAKCRKKDPVVLEAQDRGAKYAFRGTVICCGVDADGEDTDIRRDFLADEYPIEPAYGDDTICIPSVPEWLEIPERKRDILTGGFWCWTREIDENGVAATIVAEKQYINEYTTNANGAVVSFVDLRRLPNDVADKIRASKMRFTHPDTGEVFENTVCFENTSPLPFTMVKITKDVYGIRAGRRNKILGRSTDLERIDRDQTKTYEESWLRAYLNSDYLEQLIKYIREH